MYSTGKRSNTIKGLCIAIGVLSGIAFEANPANAQNFSCANPGSIPAIALPAQFNIWGPAAVCATASAATALSSVLNTANTAFLTHTGAFVASPPGAPDSTGGGIWARTIGGHVDVTGNGTATASGAVSLPATGIPFTSLTTDSKTRTDYGGVQFGGDIAKFNLGGSGWNGHVGLTGGFLGSRSDNAIGVGSTDFSIPFIGLYAVVVHSSGFFADFLLRFDHYDIAVTNSVIGLNGQGFSGRNVSATGTAGYNIALGSNWFIEPSGGLIWSHMNVDALSVPGGGPFGVPTGTATFNDIESLLGRAAVRVGTSFATPTLSIQPYGVASVWHEFADPTLSQFTCGGCAFALNVSSSRLGTYGQFGLGVAVQAINTGWIGYARIDYRTGDSIEGFAGNIGLRYQWGGEASPRRGS